MLAVTRAVPLKLLPFDNKNELQIIIDMPRARRWSKPMKSRAPWAVIWPPSTKSPIMKLIPVWLPDGL